MSAKPAQLSSAANNDKAAGGNASRTPFCLVIDTDPSIRRFVSLVLHGGGIDTEEFADGGALHAVLARRAPDLIFLDIPLESAEAIACIVALGKSGYRGQVQLMSNRGAAVLAHVKSIGVHHKLKMLPVLRKPFETNVIVKLLGDLKLGHLATVAGRIDLADALSNTWIEFWYQPKIDLRKKQLIGAETLARVRHPEYGILMPGAFMPGATEADLIALSEMALTQAIEAGLNFSKLGANLRMAINIPVDVLIRIAIDDVVESYRPQFEKWPGLIIDIAEDDIVGDLRLATDIAKKLAHLDIKLAIDDCGRGHSALHRLAVMPFAEVKLDRAFVNDCATDKTKAPLCKTVIDLAHNFGSTAVAIGIEKASDALALVSMGCDYGQGFLLGQPMPEERFASLLRQRAMSPGPHTAAAAPRAREKRPA